MPISTSIFFEFTEVNVSEPLSSPGCQPAYHNVSSPDLPAPWALIYQPACNLRMDSFIPQNEFFTLLQLLTVIIFTAAESVIPTINHVRA